MKELLLSLLHWAAANPGALVTAVLGTIFGVYQLGERRRQYVAAATRAAFGLVEDMDAIRGDAVLDKEVAGLRAADEWMVSHGWRVLKPNEVARAKIEFKALNAASNSTAQAIASVVVPPK